MAEAEKCSKWSVVSAMFLVGGTCIGGGMLALPVATGPSGFIPSLLLMLLCWAAMTVTALLLLEVSLWLDDGAHIISMSGTFLGQPGKIAAWVLYCFICYLSIIAYTAEGGAQVSAAVHSLFNLALSKGFACLVFILLFGSTIYLGSLIVGKVNAILFIAMIVAYFLLIGVGVHHIQIDLLLKYRWTPVWLSMPFLLTSFSFQTMVPSLTPYLKRNPNCLRWAAIGGTTIALIIYVIWQSFVLGVIPLEGPQGLIVALQEGRSATQNLKFHVGSGALALIAEYFAFFALVTSFLGMTLGLFDFLADGLKISKVGFGRLVLLLLIAVPTLLAAVYYERAFIVALEASGGYGDAILNGIMPVLMIWVGRYHMGMEGVFRVPGGKPLLSAVLLFFTFALCMQIAIHSGWAADLGISIPEDMLYYKVEGAAEELL